MKKKMKRAKEAKARWENEAKGKVESFVRKLSLQWKVRERIDAANAWAVKHPKRIQNGKNVQVRGIGLLVIRGQRLKWELDSLVHIPVKTHQDSMLIISKYRQLEMIVANLKHQ